MTAIGPSQTKSDSELLKEWDETPLFMKSLPEDYESNPMLSAIQTLIFDGTPLETATNFKNQGNESFKAGPKFYVNALSFYTQALEAKCDDLTLTSIIYSNRAAVHVEMKNYRKALNDCAKAIQSNPSNMKAYLRSAKSLFAVDKLVEAIDCIEKGLHIEPENETFLNEKKKYSSKLELVKKAEIKKEQFRLARFKEEQTLMERVNSRGIKYKTSKPIKPYDIKSQEDFNVERNSLLPSVYHPQAGHHRVIYDVETSTLFWPIMILYPEYSESDFFSQCDEQTLFIEIITLALEHRLPWDVEEKYSPETVSIFFEGKVNDKTTLFKVGNELTLADVLAHENYIVNDGVPSFLIIPEKSTYSKEFRMQYI